VAQVGAVHGLGVVVDGLEVLDVVAQPVGALLETCDGDYGLYKRVS
jgi:hypothetical protein